MKWKILQRLLKIMRLVMYGVFIVAMLPSMLFAAPPRIINDDFQSAGISGKVVDEAGAALPGVTVVVKGTANGTTTDAEGQYKIDAEKESMVLVFSFIGYATQEIAAGSQTTINVTLVTDAKALQEVVVVGYGEQTKLTVTGSVVAVNGADLVKSPAIDLSNSFAGRMSGVVAVQPGGEPGYDQSTIRIRGVNTMGNQTPLIVVDGIPDRDGGLNRISPQDVESISVLKDASAAIYGSRAANGVIIVTTKRGKSGVPQISYDFNQGWAQPTRTPKMANSTEYANIMNQDPVYSLNPTEWNAGWSAIQQNGTFTSPSTGQIITANFAPADVQKYAQGNDPWGHPNTDWFKTTLKTWAPQSRQNIQIAGGNENVKYLASVGYVYQDAIYNNSATFYKQYNMRFNLDAKINKYINTSLGLMVREEERNFPTQSAGSIFRMTMRGRPTDPEVWPNGLPGPAIENGQNPYVITTGATGYIKNPTDYIQSNGKIEITNPWVDGLKLTFMGSADKSINSNKMWETPWYLYSWDKITYEPDGKTPLLTKNLASTFSDPRLTMSTGNKMNTNLTAMLNYDHKFGSHTIGFLAGVQRETFKADFYQAYRRDYISTAIDQPFFGGTTQLVTGGNDNLTAYNRARLGYYGRVTYNYNEKYLAEFMWRRDGSSFFAPDHRYGFFPGVMLGWNMSNENFMSNLKFVNFLKLRGSYGQMGSDAVYDPATGYTNLVEYAYLSVYQPGYFPINSQVATTLIEGRVANPNYTWEVSNNSNVGLEGTVLNGKIDFAFDYFNNVRTNMLIFNSGSTPASTGMQSILPPVNGGKMTNKGFDFTVGYNGGQGSGLKYRIGFNGGYNQNTINYMNEIQGNPSYQWQTGHTWQGYLAYQSAGAFKDMADVANEKLDYSGVTSNLRPGDMKFVDTNHDGKIDVNDAVRLNRSGVPNFNYGATINLQYKNFDLSILFQGAAGALLQWGTESGDIGNYTKYNYDHRWSIDNPSSTDPRLANRGNTYFTGGNYGVNTYYLYSKNYIRLKNLELGYNMPSALTKKVGISKLRFYVNGLNLITWSKYNFFDPESTSGSLQYYPQSRVINTGFRVTF